MRNVPNMSHNNERMVRISKTTRKTRKKVRNTNNNNITNMKPLTKKEIRRLIYLQQCENTPEVMAEMMLLLSKASPQANQAIDDLLFRHSDLRTELNSIVLGVLIGYGLAEAMKQ